MLMMNSNLLVSCKWLKDNLYNENICILDASFFLKNDKRDGFFEWNSKRIPTSLYFDFNKKIKEHNSLLPNMLPSPGYFSEQVGLMGISNDTHIIIYDNCDFFSAPRVWWMFKIMGHQKISILDGGLKRWIDLGYPIEEKLPQLNIIPVQYNASFQSNLLANYDDVMSASMNKDLIIDARSPDRFNAQNNNDRVDHIPHSKNLYYRNLLKSNEFPSFEKIYENFMNVITPEHLNEHIIYTCGSGVTACILAFCGYCIGAKNFSIYDGSWSEWSQIN